jgi:myo-inositol-hexaphosphate 3-phosphohydrolase
MEKGKSNNSDIEQHIRSTQVLISVIAASDHPLNKVIIHNMQKSNSMHTQTYLQGFGHGEEY